MEIESFLAIVTVASFAIQQLLELLDPLVTALARRWTHWREGGAALTENELKRVYMGLVSFAVGLGAAQLLDLRLFKLVLGPEQPVPEPGDLIVTALVLGAGTEAMNTLTKFAGHAKDKRKAETVTVEVGVVPQSARVGVAKSFLFLADVRGSGDKQVLWQILDPAGGHIDSRGLYTASNIPGVYQVVASSRADASKRAVATVTVV